MNKIFHLRLLILNLCLASLLTITRYALAQDIFALSYSLTEGGYQLELNPANPYKGLNLEVSSNVATRYEVIQKILIPLENRDNPGTFIEDNFVVRGIRGINKGTLHIPPNDIRVRSEEILYTSNTVGDADNFTLVYGLVNIEDISPGHYYGKIAFTLQPIGSARSIDIKYLDVYVTKGEEARAIPRIEIITSTGAKTITLNSQKEGLQTFDVIVKINSSFKNLFSIVQSLVKPLESLEGNRLGERAVNFVVQGAKTGTAASLVMPLSIQQETLYTSGPSGQADESFIITYSLGDLSKEQAGRYSSLIQYFLEETGKMRIPLEKLMLEVENERLFELVVNLQDEKGLIEFRNLKPQEGPKKNEVIIEVKTNINQRYQVNQNLYSELTDKEGNIIPKEYFSLRTESLDTKGTLKFPDKQPVQKGETVLFISDNNGSPDKFKVIYELTCPADLKAGDYSTRVRYSLAEI